MRAGGFAEVGIEDAALGRVAPGARNDGEGEALLARCCETAQVPYQKYSHRSNLACGSTIGPITAAGLGIRVVDIGNAQLSMHSIREMCGSADPEFLVRALVPFFSATHGS
jgi:aspartyl aminopeptidase